MPLRIPYRNYFIVLFVWLASILVSPAQAVILNFSATVAQGTCALDLDKSVLPLGDVFLPDLKKGKLLNATPVNLLISKCSAIDALTQQATITITGTGISSGGRWLFREQNAEASNVGVMLFQQEAQPLPNDREIKNGDTLLMAAKGVLLDDQILPFYAGVSCGSSDGCRNAGAGELTARIIFSFAYR